MVELRGNKLIERGKAMTEQLLKQIIEGGKQVVEIN